MGLIDYLKIQKINGLKELSDRDEKYIIDLLKRSQFPIETLKTIKNSIITSRIYKETYGIVETNDDKKELIKMTPIKEVETLKFYIKADYKNFDYLNFDKLRQNDETKQIYTDVIFEYYNQVNDSYLNYKNSEERMPEDLESRREMAGELNDEARDFLNSQKNDVSSSEN